MKGKGFLWYFPKIPYFEVLFLKLKKAKAFFSLFFFCCGLDILCAGKISKWIFQALWVQSNIQSSIHHQHLISLESPHELRWILIMMEAHAEDLCEVKKKKMPPRDLQFPQSPVNLNISTKWRDSQGQRRRLYLHKSWEESSRQVKKKKKKKSSSTHEHLSVLCKRFFLCICHTFSLLVFCFPLSWFMCFSSVFCCLSDRFESLLFAIVSIVLFHLSPSGCSSVLTILRVIFQLARSSRSSKTV